MSTIALIVVVLVLIFGGMHLFAWVIVWIYEKIFLMKL